MSKPDLTYRAVTRQLQGMHAKVYEIGVLDPVADQMLARTFTPQQVITSLSWLKRENAKGHHLYIRPQGSQGLILVDDLTQGAIRRMREDDLAAAVEIETSPHNFQVWVRVSDIPIPEDLASTIARLLAQRYDGDPGAVGWNQYGRLAGFTNRKPGYIQANGTYPYVKLHVYNGKLAINAPELLTEAREALEATQAPKNTQPSSQGHDSAARIAFTPVLSPEALADPIGFYERNLARLTNRYGAAYDPSRGDWMIAVAMAKNGFSRKAITEALEQASPDLTERKGKHSAYYIKHTLDKVDKLPEIIAARTRLADRLQPPNSNG